MDQAMKYARRTQVAVVCDRCGARSAYCHAPHHTDDAAFLARVRAIDDGWRVVSITYAKRLASLPPGANVHPPTDSAWHCPACAAEFLAWLKEPQLSDRKASP